MTRYTSSDSDASRVINFLAWLIEKTVSIDRFRTESILVSLQYLKAYDRKNFKKITKYRYYVETLEELWYITLQKFVGHLLIKVIHIQVLLKVKDNEDKSFCACRYCIITTKGLGIRVRQINSSSPVNRLKKKTCFHLQVHKNRSITISSRFATARLARKRIKGLIYSRSVVLFRFDWFDIRAESQRRTAGE